MLKHVQLDLETLSVRPNAVILVIGAIKFDFNGKDWDRNMDSKDLENKDTFYERIKISTCIHEGMHIDKETEKWWKEQDDNIKYEALLNPDRMELKDALKKFAKWFGTDTWTKIWACGSVFDVTILAEAYTRCGMEIPWKFWNVRDVRTVYDLGNIKARDLPQSEKHNALVDCHRQIIGMQMAMENIKKYGCSIK